MTGTHVRTLPVNVVELNPYAPRPFVFTEAARRLRDAIEAAGYVSHHSINEADVDALNIVLGGVAMLQEILKEFDPARTIVFNFEQLGSDSILLNDAYLDWLRDWTVADYHSANVAYLKQRNGSEQRVFELPLKPRPALHTLAVKKSVDVVFYGTLSERRSGVIRKLQAQGLTVETVAGAYAEELTPALQRARLVLHVHFYATGLFPVARMLQPVENGVPIVCETSVFSELSDWSGSGILFADYEDLAGACQRLLQAPAEQLTRAQRSRDFAAHLDFATPFNAVVAPFLRRACE